jgi:hypothetical protein
VLYVISYTDEDALAVLKFTLDYTVVQRFEEMILRRERCAHELSVVSVKVPEESTHETLEIDGYYTLERMLGID